LFGIGGWELLVVIVVALIVLGPRRLPGAAKGIGKAVTQLRRATRELRQSIELDPDLAELPRALDDIGRPIIPRGPVTREAARRKLPVELGGGIDDPPPPPPSPSTAAEVSEGASAPERAPEEVPEEVRTSRPEKAEKESQSVKKGNDELPES